MPLGNPGFKLPFSEAPMCDPGNLGPGEATAWQGFGVTVSEGGPK